MIVHGSKNNSEFDITMGSYDGAEICELVGLVLLHELSTIIPKELTGLRDDSLAILQNSSGPNTDRIKKGIIKLFQKHNLKITIEANIIQTDFLDVTFNLKTEKHWPFRKPNHEQLYININSNHPPSIKKAPPNMISNRLSELSCDLDNFKKAIPLYKNAIKQSGYKDNLIFNEPQLKNKKSYGSTRLLTTMLPTISEKSF